MCIPIQIPKKPFYVDKGKNNRVFDHLEDEKESEKAHKIKDIRKRGKEPIIEILAHGLDEETALKVEAAAIDLIGIKNLTNRQRGHDSSTYGKIEVSTLDARYNNKTLDSDDIIDNILFIRINKRYRNDMSPFELYEATRGYWRLKFEHAQKVDYALSVYDGMVLEVYEVIEWLPALSTFMNRSVQLDSEKLKKRYEFIGKIADDKIKKRYVDKNVKGFFAPGESNPIKYVFGKK